MRQVQNALKILTTAVQAVLGLTGNASAGDVITGKTFYKDDYETKLTGTLVLDGDSVAANVLAGKTFYKDDPKTKLTGTMVNKTAAALVITPSTIDQAIPVGFYPGAAGDGKVLGDADLVTGNIKNGATIFGVAGKVSVVDTADSDAVAADIALGKTAYCNGVKITGTAE